MTINTGLSEFFASPRADLDAKLAALHEADIPTSFANVTWDPDTYGDPDRVESFRIYVKDDDRYKATLVLLRIAEAPLINFRNECLDIEDFHGDATDDPVLFAAAEALEGAFDQIESCIRTLENEEA